MAKEMSERERTEKLKRHWASKTFNPNDIHGFQVPEVEASKHKEDSSAQS